MAKDGKNRKDGSKKNKKRDKRGKTSGLEDRSFHITDFLNEASRSWQQDDKMRNLCCNTWSSFPYDDLGRAIVAFGMATDRLSEEQLLQMYDWPPAIHELIHWVVRHATCPDPSPFPDPEPGPDPNPFSIPPDFPFPHLSQDRFPPGPIRVRWESELGDPPALTVRLDTNGEATVTFTLREIV